ncbi:MAG: hypothetical protein IT210_07120 [Armatimonadetes bacterium]|nr:hypothetical protein [Armatimonadota bacterium]
MQLTGLGSPASRSLILTGRYVQGTVRASLENTESQSTPWKGALTVGDNPVRMSPGPLPPGLFTLRFEAASGDRLMAAFRSRFQALPDFETRLQSLPLSRILEIDARFHGPNAPDNVALTARLRSPNGKTVRSGPLPLNLNRSRAPLRWSYAGLPQGSYTVAFTHKKESIAEIPWKMPSRPAWLGSKAGRFGDDHVPKPWNPLRVASRSPLKVACWGRQYAFTPSGMLASVRSKGKELLTSPAIWEGSLNGQRIVWMPQPVRIRKAARGAVEFTARQTAPGLRLTAEGRMEFDGFVKISTRLEGLNPSARLDRLTLRIPLRRDVARLLHHFPKPSVWLALDMKRFNARAVPARGWQSHFLNHVWVGDEEKGLQWLCECDEGWRPADPQKAIELSQEGGRTVLKLNLIGRPTRLDRPRQYAFAFQASPVKPYPPDYRRWHHSQVGSYDIEKTPHRPRNPITIAYPARGHFNPERGTVEVTFIPKFDSTAPGEFNKSLFSLLWPDDRRPEPEAGVWFYWNQDDKGMRAVVREDSRYRYVYGGRFNWKRGETHTAAFTWGEETAVYVDGQKIAAMPEQGTLSPSADLLRARIILGGPGCDFIVRRIRISDIPLPAESLGRENARLSADNHTLLLDHFEGMPEGERRTSPVRSASRAGGELSPEAKAVKGGLDLSHPKVQGTTLDYLQRLGIRWIGFHEYWTDWQGYPRTHHTRELRSLLDASHKRGMKVILYHSWQLPDIALEYPLYLKECEVVSPERFLYTRTPQQTDYPVCPKSAWADFMADGIARLFDRFRPDGIYSDGLTYPSECSNALHGCGYIGEDGRRHPTVPIFATREAVKRFARILEEQHKPTLFVAHTSGSITLPTLAFTSAYLDAEHLTGRPRPFRLPLDAFRAEFMGHNFGLPAYFLVYNWNQGITTTEAMALCLLHDTELPWSYEAMAPVWKLWEDFKIEKARFLPYWNAQGWLLNAPPGVRASAYVKPDGEALAVASNLSEQAVTGTLRFKWSVLSAKEALTGQTVPSPGGRIEDRFPSYRARLYRVKLRR